jgi:hypothetical protein
MINKRNFSRIIAVITLMLLMPREGYMSQSFLDYISLDNLVQGSDLILVVSKMNPDITLTDMPFDSSGRFPPFKLRHFHFQVIETLYDRSGLKNLKNPIDVVAAGEDSRYENEKKTLIEGQPPVSPICLAYKPSLPYEKLSGPFIVFLSRQGDHLTLAAISSCESVKNKKRIMRLIKKLPESHQVVSPPKTANQSNPPPLLNLMIKLDHTQFVIGDSIPIKVTLENLGKSPAQVPDPAVGSEFQFILTSTKDQRNQYYFSRERAINERYPLETPAPQTDLTGLELAPGARQIYIENLTEYIVNPPSPGEYTLEVGYKEGRSNEVVIRIFQHRASGKR